jgi:phage terminase small subunit
MGKAKHPHDASRPLPARIRKALEAGDIEGIRDGLTTRQRHFAEEYIVDYNATAAALRAGYSSQWADRQGHILTKHEGIKAYVDYLTRSKEAKIVSIDPDWVINKVVQIVGKEGVRDGDQLRALELLARHLGMFIERTEITGKDGGPLALEQKQRVEEEATNFTNALKRMQGKPDLKVVKNAG